MKTFDEQYEEYKAEFKKGLATFCEKMSFQPPILTESMRYSLLLGGKRVRPALFFAFLDLLALDWKKEINFAIAIECIHTYSLIHDDLPAMDNDDFRRGKPSNHKKFGEGNAILAGDALLNAAYSILFRESMRGSKELCAASYLCDAAGADGMIAGQSADLLYSNFQGDFEGREGEYLRFIYENKTAKLITAPLVMAAILAEYPIWEIEQFGNCLGNLFQLVDDILDVVGEKEQLGKTTGKDEAENKLTSVKLYGLQECEFHADMLAEKCHGILDGIKGDVSFLHSFVDMLRHRTK